MDNSNLIRRWREKPLRRRYAVVVFHTVAITVLDEHGPSAHHVQLALGQLNSGEYESLGAWSCLNGNAAISSRALADARARGAEFICCAVGANLDHEEGGLTAVFPHTQVLKSPERLLAVAIASLPPGQRRSVEEFLRASADAQDQDDAQAELGRFQRSDLGARYPDVVQFWGDVLARFEAAAKLSAPMKALVRSADQTAMEVQERLTKEIKRHGPFVDAAEALDFVSGALMRAERRLDRERERSMAGDVGPFVSRGRSLNGVVAVGVPRLA